MTKIIYILLISVSIAACNQKASKTQKLDAGAIETDESTNKEPVISFDKKIWDFGTITDGEVVEHTFRFTNTGTNDLIISNASASCGCTIPEWPKEPIAPGEKGEIKVEFNSNGKRHGNKRYYHTCKYKSGENHTSNQSFCRKEKILI
jgi:hypothetical protein